VHDHPYLPFLEKVLTPERLDHSLGVMQVMGELAEVYGLDREMARTIGILHDAGKDLPPDQQEHLILEGNIQAQPAFETNYEYMHGPVGSYFVQRELGISDPLILDAITTHTFIGSSPYFHHPLSWCLRFSDIHEPNRDWAPEPLIQALEKHLKELAYGGKMAEAALLYTETVIRWFTEKGRPIHPNMVQAKEELAAQMRDQFISIKQITTLMNHAVGTFPHGQCETCECFLGHVTQLEIDTEKLGKAFLKTYKPNRSAIHSCLGCDPCPPGDQFAAYIRENTP